MADLSPEALKALSSLRRGEQTQELIERTLGQGLLAKMQGQEPDLLEIYKDLGGNDPGVVKMLDGRLSEEFRRLPVQAGVEAARQAALSQTVQRAAESKSSREALVGSPVFSLEGQALNTLANLGGPEFAQKFKVGG
jgi:hypothetical protein